ncbi:STAS domain-containing protein [Streptomyces flavofungini]|uniref:STAS domain-containing protein n=1 Tax=Streptomyces flavofungini TaxID=68200 RepID=UPI0034DEB384
MTSIPGKGWPERLSIEKRTINGIRVVTLHGEIDLDTVAAVRDALVAPGSEGFACVVADLSAVTYLDSSGTNVFVAAHRVMNDVGGWLRIAGARESVRRVIELIGLDLAVDCHPTLQQALAG